jgi:hypothetical protein
MGIYSTVDYLRAQGARDGKERGLQEGACRQTCKLLLRHGKRAFGDPGQDQRDALEALADRLGLAELERLCERFPRATNWAELLDGMTVPQEAPAAPEYLLPFEFDPTPLPPSIDNYFKVELTDGGSEVIHLRFQRLYQEDLGAILHRESEQLRQRYGGSVRTVVLLLWPGADGPAMTGEHRLPGGGVYQYNVTRLWEKDADEMVNSPATAVFAPLARFDPERLPEVLRRVGETLTAHAKDEEMLDKMWGLTYCCMGLRYPAEQVNELLAPVLPLIYRSQDTKGVLSEGYYEGHSSAQAEGALRATQRWVLTLGGQRLSEPPAGVEAALAGIRSLERLEQLAARVLKTATWQEALAPN